MIKKMGALGLGLVCGLSLIGTPMKVEQRTVFDEFSRALGKVTPGEKIVSGQKVSRETQLEKLIHAKINKVRLNHGLKQLQWNETLATIARTHSKDMAMRHYFSHDTQPDNKRNPPPGFAWRYKAGGFNEKIETSRIVEKLSNGSTQTKIEYSSGAENIFKDPLNILVNGKPVYESLETTAQDVVDGWMKSKGHRENILTAYLIREGIGVVIAYEKGFEFAYVTQDFC